MLLPHQLLAPVIVVVLLALSHSSLASPLFHLVLTFLSSQLQALWIFPCDVLLFSFLLSPSLSRPSPCTCIVTLVPTKYFFFLILHYLVIPLPSTINGSPLPTGWSLNSSVWQSRLSAVSFHLTYLTLVPTTPSWDFRPGQSPHWLLTSANVCVPGAKPAQSSQSSPKPYPPQGSSELL